MMRLILTILLFFHGLIHLMGFIKAFGIGNMEQFTKEISRPIGVLWLLTGLLFVISAGLNLMKKETWLIVGIIAVILSQMLIFTTWKDAKFGTIPNIIILGVAITGFASVQFENRFKEDIVSALEKTAKNNEIIIEKDLEHLPLLVQKYLQYVGVEGKPKIRNVKIVFNGEMREKGKDWFKFTSEQYNFLDDPTRLFFMKAKVKRIHTNGYHKYNEEGASMLIKLLSVFPLVNIQGKEMYATETITFFNDLCLFAPATLVDKRIVWETIDNNSVKATFTNNGTSISAFLFFNETGQLVNFISDDRIDINQGKKFRFSTPVKYYKYINGYNLPTYGEATWHYPDGEFVYGKFKLKEIKYNVSQ